MCDLEDYMDLKKEMEEQEVESWSDLFDDETEIFQKEDGSWSVRERKEK